MYLISIHNDFTLLQSFPFGSWKNVVSIRVARVGILGMFPGMRPRMRQKTKLFIYTEQPETKKNWTSSFFKNSSHFIEHDENSGGMKMSAPVLAELGKFLRVCIYVTNAFCLLNETQMMAQISTHVIKRLLRKLKCISPRESGLLWEAGRGAKRFS